jgi:hypothetical protein
LEAEGSNTQTIDEAIRVLRRVGKHINKDNCKCCREALQD